MSTPPTADEVFALALEIEETGRVFYETAGSVCTSEEVHRLCRWLAEAESRHAETFARLRRRLGESPSPEPLRPEQATVAQAIINQRVLPDVSETLTAARSGDLARTLDLAIALEDRSIRFYSDILPAVDRQAARAVEQILQEEHHHVRELTYARQHLH